MQHNIVTLTDSYKFTHHKMYPGDTETVYSYFESREGARFDETVFFGLQYYLKKYLAGSVVTFQDIVKAQNFAAKHFGNEELFNREGWMHILKAHKGRLPVRIKAVPEGTVVPTGNVLMTVENTDPKCFWLTNHLETILSHMWYSSTVATLSRRVKQTIKKYLDETAESDAGLPFMLHDFGFRGTSSVESAGFGGAAHLVNFLGTDTVAGIELADEYYGAGVCGHSVPATEHSVMTSYGPDGEDKIFAELLREFPTGILSVVSDSYHIYRAVSEIIGEQFRDQILRRDGVFVVRPDSGNPVATTWNVLVALDDKFGSTVNDKGYRVLNPKVRVIWGDGIDAAGIDEILAYATKHGGRRRYSAENLVFGMGGGLLQKVNRDTQRFAFKCSWQQRAGIGHNIYKQPVAGGKGSKPGRLALVNRNGLTTIPESMVTSDDENLLETVFEDGKLIKDISFDEVRENARV